MSQCPLLHVPLKTTEEVDWIAPLRKYIESVYMDEADKYSEELHTFNRIRQDMRGAGVDNTGRDLLYRYFGQLDLLELRFQVDENNVKINFPWNDAFTQKKISQHSLAYEKACVIFNIAALLSNIASSQNRFEVQGLKTAYHNFQLSAGIFTYINENFLHAPSSDLNREIIKVLIQFMLAQAQECFLEKCITEKKKNTLIAKLASQLNYLYTNIVDALTESLPKKLFPQSMSLLAKTKIKLYSSVAQFNKAKSLEDEGEYGEAVSRFTLAEELAKEAMACTYNLSRVIGTSNSIFPLDAAKALDVITKRNHDEYLHKMENAVKENDMIYHHPVINHDVLVPIDKLPASKIIPFSQLYNPGDLPRVIGHDLFRKLIPLSVHESASLYSEEMAKLVRLETERIDVADSELEASLSYMSLPDCLTRFKKEDNNLIHTVIIPPEEIIKLNNEIYQKEQNGKSIQSLLSSLPKANKELRQVLEECSSILDMELRNGENLRAKFQDLWTQDPSSTAASGIRQEIRVNRELLEKAIESDNLMFSKFNSNKEDLLIIKSDPSQDRLGQIYAEIITAASTKNSMSGLTESLVDLDKEDFLSNSVTLVYELIDKLKGLKRERKEVLHDLKEQVKNDDISSLLILNKKSVSVEPQLFANELEKYRSHQDRITTTIHHQQTALQEITEHMKKLMDNDESKKINKGWNMIDNVRDNLNLRFKKVADLFYEIHSNSSDGQSFYNDVKPVVHNLLGRVKRFDEERRIERENIQREIEKGKQNLNYELLQSHLQKYENSSLSSHSSSNQIDNELSNRMSNIRLNEYNQSVPTVNYNSHVSLLAQPNLQHTQMSSNDSNYNSLSRHAQEQNYYIDTPKNVPPQQNYSPNYNYNQPPPQQPQYHSQQYLPQQHLQQPPREPSYPLLNQSHSLPNNSSSQYHQLPSQQLSSYQYPLKATCQPQGGYQPPHNSTHYAVNTQLQDPYAYSPNPYSSKPDLLSGDAPIPSNYQTNQGYQTQSMPSNNQGHQARYPNSNPSAPPIPPNPYNYRN